MKTSNGKNITKKHIEAVLRTMNPTQIFRLYHMIYGGKVEKSKVYGFIKENAPTNKVADAAYHLAFLSKEVDMARMEIENLNGFSYAHDNTKHIVMQHFREELRRGFDEYSKRPIMGHTYLYWASPFYGHDDYNKSRALPIAGNERFCELICSLADKYYSKE